MEGKKKRGRKPKNKIIQNENPVFDNGNKLDNLIVCLKTKKNDGVMINTNEINENNIQSSISFNELNNDNLNDNDLSEQYKINSNDNNKNKCWNCHQCIDCNTISFPLKYIDNIFYTYGDFCSFECSARYIFETYDNKELWDKYTLLNLYYNKMHNTHNKKVNFALSRLVLKEFGGEMSIDEYRKKFTKDFHCIYIPPIIPINHIFHNGDNNKLNDNNNELKIYRKKGLNKNNIYKKMEINL